MNPVIDPPPTVAVAVAPFPFSIAVLTSARISILSCTLKPVCVSSVL